MLRIEDLHVKIGDREVLRGVNLHIAENETFILFGPNGSGKTTLLMTICGSPRATSGSVHFEGENITELPSHHIMRKGIAISPEGRRIFPALTVIENLQMGGFFLTAQEIAQGMEHVFHLFPRLRERATQRAGTMSGGEQQMLTVARTLMGQPYVVLLDEPSEGVAPLIVEQMARTIMQLKAQGIGILLSEQNLPFAQVVADRAYVLEKGEIVHRGPMAELVGNAAVRQQYLGV